MAQSMSHSRSSPTATAALLSIILCTGNGCLFSGGGPTPTVQKTPVGSNFIATPNTGSRKVTLEELDQLTNGYADRYYMTMGSAVDALKRENSDPIQRRIAHRVLLNGVLSMNDIASSNDPYSQTLDLVVAVTLQSIVWIDENRAEKVFGERAPILIKALRTMRVEAWELAARILNPEQLELLDYYIVEWRRANPANDQVAFVKFDNFASLRSGGLLSDLKSGGGFLASIQEAGAELKEYRRLAERAFWYSKRAPNLAGLQAEAAVNEILAAPEIGSIIQTADKLGATAASIPQMIERERQGIFAELDARQTLLTNTLVEVRTIVLGADALSRSISTLTTNLQQTLVTVGDTLKTVDGIAHRYGLDQPSPRPASQPSKPFDIQDYVTAVDRLNGLVTNVHGILIGADQFTRSEGWNKALRDTSDLADQRLDRLFHNLWLTLGIGFFGTILHRLISNQIGRRPTPSPSSKP